MLLPTIPEGVAWAILLLPVGSLLTIAFLTKPFPRLSGWVTIAAVGTAFLFALWALDSVIDSDGHALAFHSHHWLRIGTQNDVLARLGGPNLDISLALRIDGLSAIMLVTVTAISLVVQVYSQGYMHGDGGYSRYFAYMSLFTAAMLGLVLVDSIIFVYVFWELVGLGSYLLIGFWFEKPAAANAAKKAFLTTRLGDIGFLLAILLIWSKTNTFNIPVLQDMAQAHEISDGVLTLFALGIFAGAVGKSAQFPLHVWLPDAMEGPTPVSALIHAATMVAAGVYLVARMFPVFQASNEAMTTVAYVGGFTAIFAASMGIVMTDIKRVLAYSTISQLGYMMLALGVGGYVAAIFHLFTHAFFKALLFLGSGSVNHATGTFDMRKMGGLRKYMPITYATFLVGSLSLAGIVPFAGFWSKDEIIGAAWHDDKFLMLVALAVVFITAFYTFRAVFLTFEGEYQGGEPPQHGGAEEPHAAHPAQPHESPLVMALPLLVLAVPALLAGFVNFPTDSTRALAHLLEGALPESSAAQLHPESFNFALAAISLALALAGIGLAWVVYRAKVVTAAELRPIFGPLATLVERKYYLDDLYEGLIVRQGLYNTVCAAGQWFDAHVVDAVVNGAGQVTRRAGEALRWVQSGEVQAYGSVGFAGLLIVAFLMLVLVER
ncbi:MAG TPA: NADH-quinone oxidoreductase subunit L [Dehalococcoidia bacterium]|nr:NADH-quinone oxidoreductase subunit L [Dehalococcoidia bacterium]